MKIYDQFMASLGVSTAALAVVAAGGAFGAALSVRAIAGTGAKLIAFAGGWGAALFLTPLVALYMELERTAILGGVAFLLGLYALLLLDELATLIKSGAARQWFQTVITRKLGG